MKASKCWLTTKPAPSPIIPPAAGSLKGMTAGTSQAGGEVLWGKSRDAPAEDFIMVHTSLCLSTLTTCLLGIRKVQTLLPVSRKWKEKTCLNDTKTYLLSQRGGFVLLLICFQISARLVSGAGHHGLAWLKPKRLTIPSKDL